MLNVRGNSVHFRLTNEFSYESVEVYETENVSTRRGLENLTFGFLPNALTIWAIGVRYLLSNGRIDRRDT